MLANEMLGTSNRRQAQAGMLRELADLDEQTFAVLITCDSDEVARGNHVIAPGRHLARPRRELI